MFLSLLESDFHFSYALLAKETSALTSTSLFLTKDEQSKTYHAQKKAMKYKHDLD